MEIGGGWDPTERNQHDWAAPHLEGHMDANTPAGSAHYSEMGLVARQSDEAARRT
jgi:hypothetical protein